MSSVDRQEFSDRERGPVQAADTLRSDSLTYAGSLATANVVAQAAEERDPPEETAAWGGSDLIGIYGSPPVEPTAAPPAEAGGGGGRRPPEPPEHPTPSEPPFPEGGDEPRGEEPQYRAAHARDAELVTSVGIETGIDDTTPVTPAEVKDYLSALARANEQPNRFRNIDESVRAGREEAYRALGSLLNRNQADIPPDIPMSEVVDWLREQDQQLGLGASLSPEGQAGLAETLDLLAEHADDPEEIRYMIARHKAGAEAAKRAAAVSEAPKTTAGEARRTEVNITEARPAPAEYEYDPDAFVDDAVKAAEGSAIIGLVFPRGMHNLQLHYRGHDRLSDDAGGNVFGDGAYGNFDELPSHFSQSVGSFNPVYNGDKPEHRYVDDMVEAVAFPPAMKDVYRTVAHTERGRSFRASGQKGTHREKIGQEPIMVTNPATGREEPGAYFDYAYRPSLAGDPNEVEERLHLPPYAPAGRRGAYFVVRALIPQSFAEKMQSLRKSERLLLARKLAEETVINRGGLSREGWSHLRPPYENLPYTHKLYVVTPATDQHGRPIMVARSTA